MGEIERRGVSPELVEYLRTQQAGRSGPVHLHFHAAPEPTGSSGLPAVPVQPGVLDKAAPYLVLGVFGLFGVAAIIAVLVVAGPVIVALLGSVVAIVIAAAAAVGAVAVLAVTAGHLVDRTTAARGVKAGAKGKR